VPGWLRDLAGDDFFQKVVAIRVSPTTTDKDLVHLAALPHIEGLYVGGSGNQVSDAGLAHLPRPDRLVHAWRRFGPLCRSTINGTRSSRG
jgi:hypothetical protein